MNMTYVQQEINKVLAEGRQLAYDKLDPGRKIAAKVWAHERLPYPEFEVAVALGYLVETPEHGGLNGLMERWIDPVGISELYPPPRRGFA